MLGHGLTMAIAITIAIAIALAIAIAMIVFGTNGQRGGDPYKYIRPWIIIDVFRNLWLTK